MRLGRSRMGRGLEVLLLWVWSLRLLGGGSASGRCAFPSPEVLVDRSHESREWIHKCCAVRVLLGIGRWFARVDVNLWRQRFRMFITMCQDVSAVKDLLEVRSEVEG